MLNRGGDDVFGLLERDEFGGKFDVAAELLEEIPEIFFDAPLRCDQWARVRRAGSGIAAFVHITFDEKSIAIVGTDGQVKLADAEHVVDDAEVVEDFEAAGLETLPFRADKIGRGFVDDAERDVAAREVAGEGEAGGAGAGDQDLGFVCRHTLLYAPGGFKITENSGESGGG